MGLENIQSDAGVFRNVSTSCLYVSSDPESGRRSFLPNTPPWRHFVCCYYTGDGMADFLDLKKLSSLRFSTVFIAYSDRTHHSEENATNPRLILQIV